jgi:peptidoglycan/xylan/chitin deacetylase (PgdA/CDA1 family)
MGEKIGTLGDRIANRIIRHFPGPRVALKTDRPIVSFTMDDAPIDAWAVGAKVLEDHGARGTFYIAGRFATDEPDKFISIDQCRDLHERGHEVACHTYEHQKLSAFSRRDLIADLERNAHLLQSAAPTSARRNFAFPYGMASPKHQPLLRKTFRTSRSVIGGINRGLVDPMNLAGVELRPDAAFLDRAKAALTEVLVNPGWLVFFTHDISDQPSFYGCPTKVFQELLSQAIDGGAQVLTVDKAADYFNIPK